MKFTLYLIFWLIWANPPIYQADIWNEIVHEQVNFSVRQKSCCKGNYSVLFWFPGYFLLRTFVITFLSKVRFLWKTLYYYFQFFKVSFFLPKIILYLNFDDMESRIFSDDAIFCYIYLKVYQDNVKKLPLVQEFGVYN